MVGARLSADRCAGLSLPKYYLRMWADTPPKHVKLAPPSLELGNFQPRGYRHPSSIGDALRLAGVEHSRKELGAEAGGAGWVESSLPIYSFMGLGYRMMQTA